MKGNAKSEKLEKEAGDYAEKHAFRVPYDGSNKFYDDVDFRASKEGYIAGAKPREKQIVKLEDTLGKVETERIQLIARLAFTENALNNCKAKIEKAVDLITKLSQLEHRTDDCFTYDEYLKLIKDAKQFLNNEENEMEENEVYYVILNKNHQYEISRNYQKNEIFKGTREECEAFIEGTKCSNEHNAEFCYISSVLDTGNERLWYEVKLNDIALYSSLNNDAKARNECEAFIKGIKYELGNDKTKTHEAMYTESKVLYAMKLLKALCEGKTLQTPNGKGSWIDCNTKNIIFYDLLRFEYRIKEEDKVSKAQTCIYDTDSCRHAKYEFGEPDTSKCKDCNRNPNMNENEMEENNLRLENAEPPMSPSSVKTNDVTGYMHCDDENLNNEQLSWTPYYSYDDELRNNLKSVVVSNINIDEKINIIIALCRQTIVPVPTEDPNPYNQPKVWYCNSKPEYYTNATSTDASK